MLVVQKRWQAKPKVGFNSVTKVKDNPQSASRTAPLEKEPLGQSKRQER